MPPSAKIHTAELDWELVDGIEVPISRQFGDVYFSKDNGLLETRHVFLNGKLESVIGFLGNFEVVVAADGGTPTRGALWRRYAVGLVSLLAAGLGFWWAWIDRDRLAWHDRASGTRVVRLPRA